MSVSYFFYTTKFDLFQSVSLVLFVWKELQWVKTLLLLTAEWQNFKERWSLEPNSGMGWESRRRREGGGREMRACKFHRPLLPFSSSGGKEVFMTKGGVGGIFWWGRIYVGIKSRVNFGEIRREKRRGGTKKISSARLCVFSVSKLTKSGFLVLLQPNFNIILTWNGL